MSGKFEPRSVGPLLVKFRAFLRGRENSNPLRYKDLLSARDQPPPNVPGGPYHKTSKIYYYARDARREVQPPFVVPIGKQIAAGSDVNALKSVTPSKVYLSS